jgi:indole-3-acetate monooxygenase
VEQQVASDLIHDDPVGVALELLPLIRAHADETERERRLAAPVVDAMRAGGLFSMGVPAALGGLETPLAQVLRAIEEVSYADGASGWNIMIAFDGGLLAAHLSAAKARLLVASIPRAIIAGAVAPGQMVRTDGGYRLTGRWPFGSGCQQRR